MGLVFALFSVGYILGVWTACLVLRQPQGEYEEGGPVRVARTPAIVGRPGSAVMAMRR
jgi:hypothetical protein